jgi:hypothetical protein
MAVIIKDSYTPSFNLDLQDWKTIERNAQASIDEHRVSIVISEILLLNAEKHIKLLKGDTLKEEQAKMTNGVD